MKRSTTRKFITLVLVVAIVFTMSVPAFAGTGFDLIKKPVYFAIGDSIGAGCKNLNFMENALPGERENTSKTDLLPAEEKLYNEQFAEFTLGFEEVTYGNKIQYKKNPEVNAVEFSFISRIAKAIRADEEKSVNGSYVGLRAKDVCHILGIPAALGDTYEGEITDYNWTGPVGTGDLWYAMMNMIGNYEELEESPWFNVKSGFKDLFNDVNRNMYKDAIANSDVITIELGENDLSAFMFGGDLLNMLMPMMSPSSKRIDTKTLLKSMATLVDKLVIKSQYYFTSMMKYIQNHKKDNAVVVVSTMINPMNMPDDYEGGNDEMLELIGELSSVLDIYIEAMNTLIKTEALTYDYAVADISDIVLNPNPDKVYYIEGNSDETTFEYKEGRNEAKYANGRSVVVEYMFHPNAKDQQKIANEFIKQIMLAPVTEFAQSATKTVVNGVVAEVILSKIVDDKPSALESIKTAFDKKKEAKATTQDTSKKEETVEVKDQEPVVTETSEDQKLTDEEVTEMLSDATLRCTTSKTSKGIKVTAKVEDADLDAIKEDGYTVSYKFYRSSKKSSGYKYMLTSKTGKYTNTSVQKGNKYYYKTVLVVTDSEGNEVTKTTIKDCKYGSRTF